MDITKNFSVTKQNQLVSQKVFPTLEDQAVNQIPLERASPQQEESSTGQDTRREPDISVHHLHHHCHCSHDSPQQLLPTMLRCRALLKSICSANSSSRRRTSCGLKSRPWMGRAEPHSHRNSRTARRARSWWARWSSANRLFAPDGGQKHDSITCCSLFFKFLCLMQAELDEHVLMHNHQSNTRNPILPFLPGPQEASLLSPFCLLISLVLLWDSLPSSNRSMSSSIWSSSSTTTTLLETLLNWRDAEVRLTQWASSLFLNLRFSQAMNISNLLCTLYVTYQQFADLSQFTEETGRQNHNEQIGGNRIILQTKGQRIYSRSQTTFWMCECVQGQ